MSSGYAFALDVGERRVGVAKASVIARIASPEFTIDRQKTTNLISWAKEFFADQNPKVIVVGLPRDMKGNETNQTKLVLEFARQLSDTVLAPVVLQDEAVTSIRAEENLKRLGKHYTKADIDSEAAAIILQDYLNNIGENTA